MKPKLKAVKDDLGCIFHPGDYAPDKPEAYKRDAWIAPPLGATEPPTRRICDSCVSKIQEKASGLWEHFQYDETTGEVRPLCPRR